MSSLSSQKEKNEPVCLVMIRFEEWLQSAHSVVRSYMSYKNVLSNLRADSLHCVNAGQIIHVRVLYIIAILHPLDHCKAFFGLAN